ncbi:MAG: hypothetical protein SOW59_03620 [Corynebacterium sp.]|nr:hypothetical protein [Corynebacterium sp.]
MSETLRLVAGGRGLVSLLTRAVAIDATSLARFRQMKAGSPADASAGDKPQHPTMDVFVRTPFEVVASRRVGGEISRDGAVVSARELCDALAAIDFTSLSKEDSVDVDAGTPKDPAWPGALPPAEGFQLVDNLPVSVVRELADKGHVLARQFSGPLGPPSSLMNQTVVTVVSADETLRVDIPMRMIFACTSLGLIPGFSAPMDIPRHVRVSVCGRWIRLDAPFGTVYYSNRISLLTV